MPAFKGLDFGLLGNSGAEPRLEVLILTPDIFQAAYSGTTTLLQSGPSAQWPGGYCQCAERRQYDFQLTGTAAPTRTHGLVRSLLDPLGEVAPAMGNGIRVSRIVYDGYDLLPIETVDSLGHTTTARYDYRLLQARLVTDPNLNHTMYSVLPLGLLQQPSTWLAYNVFAQNEQFCCVKTTQPELHVN